jgi:hypothetical protein
VSRGRIRETQPGGLDPSAWEQMDRSRQVEAIQGIVERIGYDGSVRQISIRFYPPAIPAAGPEARSGTGGAGVSGHQDVTYTLNFGAGRPSRRENRTFSDREMPAPEAAEGGIPRIARLLALAIRLEGLLRAETIRDCGTGAPRRGDAGPYDTDHEVARSGSGHPGTDSLSAAPPGLNERNLRPITSRIDWDEQRRMFQRITDLRDRVGTRRECGAT